MMFPTWLPLLGPVGKGNVPGLTVGTPTATTSGTSVDITTGFAGAKRITITFSGVSTSGSSPYEIKLGDSGGLEESGYVGYVNRVQNGLTIVATDWPTDAIKINTTPAAAHTYVGVITLTLHDTATNTWEVYGGISISGQTNTTCGEKALSDTLTQIRLTTANGTDTFDAGSINFLVET